MPTTHLPLTAGRFAIRCVDERGAAWSNLHGFVDNDSFTTFSADERVRLGLPVGGAWCTVAEMHAEQRRVASEIDGAGPRDGSVVGGWFSAGERRVLNRLIVDSREARGTNDTRELGPTDSDESLLLAFVFEATLNHSRPPLSFHHELDQTSRDYLQSALMQPEAIAETRVIEARLDVDADGHTRLYRSYGMIRDAASRDALIQAVFGGDVPLVEDVETMAPGAPA